ncbi:hypothetical protein B0H14DRAFT_2932751 [Mycena olivaceomarginata]|nr:hypothetical protein B0H14DRAFT_2932751 [Mycena olivaceomarginata]
MICTRLLFFKVLISQVPSFASSMSSGHEHLLALIADVTFVLLLIAIAYLQWNTCSRPYLNRVSFRLLICASSKCCPWVAHVHQRKGGRWGLCSACMFCCIALNLPLVIVFGVNGNKMEKFYIIGSVILCLACNIPPLAYGKLGWYAVNGTCWFRDPSPSSQLRWLVGAQSVWMVLMSTVEIISFLIIVIFMTRHEARIQHLRADALSRGATACMTLESSRPAHPIVRYRPLILRIGKEGFCGSLLPSRLAVLVSTTFCMYNTMITTLRPLLYALLASTDPVLIPSCNPLSISNSSPQPSSSSSSPPSQLTLPTLNLTAPSSSCTTRSPHASDKWDNTISVKQNAAACSQHENVALQI